MAAACGQALKSVTLELDGKSAAIILDDADVDAFIKQVPAVCLANSGQGCFLSTLIVVGRSRFCDGLAETLGAMPVGDPLDLDSCLARLSAPPSISVCSSTSNQVRRRAHVQSSGAGRPERLTRGYIVEPTVFVDVAREMRIFHDEIFGPVLAVVPAGGGDDAVATPTTPTTGWGG